ncbi:MAG: helix-turn-helix domain-containing protein [Haloferacaceae archaeon]
MNPSVVADATGGVETMIPPADIGRTLDVIADGDCRAILDTTGCEPMTAAEISDQCGIPLSTTYRKLDRLTDENLLEERTRVRRVGKHARQYERVVDELHIHLTGDGDVEVDVTTMSE